jgi:hypothetical protein
MFTRCKALALASPDVGLQQLYIVPSTLKGIVDGQEAVTDEQYSIN